MSVVLGSQVAVDHTGESVVAQAIDALTDAPEGQVVRIANRDATHSVWLGGPGVTDSTGAKPGYELKAGEVLDWTPLPPGAQILGIALAAQTVIVHVLAVGS